MRFTRHLIIGCLVLQGMVPVASAEFSDVSEGDAFAPAVENLKAQNVIEGYGDGTFRPHQRVNRAEFLKMVMIASHRNTLPESSNRRCFTDFRGTEAWYWVYACAAEDQSLVDGYPDGTFRGEQSVNLVEALKIAAHAWDMTLPVFIRAPDNWYDPYVIVAREVGVFSFMEEDPDHFLTRGEIAMIIDAYMDNTPCGGREIGESFKAPDGCNTCTCTENGVACTKMYCAERTCTSSNDCRGGEICSTEQGDCRSICPPGAEACPAVCGGVCIPDETDRISCTERQQDLKDVFDDHRTCVTHSDCMNFVSACPFVTCGEAINKNAQNIVSNAVEDYLDACPTQECAACLAQEALCEHNRCVLREYQY